MYSTRSKAIVEKWLNPDGSLDRLTRPTLTFKAFLPHHFPSTSWIASWAGGFLFRTEMCESILAKMHVLPITEDNRRFQVFLCRAGLDSLLCRTTSGQ
jgi:hypothetical protein